MRRCGHFFAFLRTETNDKLDDKVELSVNILFFKSVTPSKSWNITVTIMITMYKPNGGLDILTLLVAQLQKMSLLVLSVYMNAR